MVPFDEHTVSKIYNYQSRKTCQPNYLVTISIV